MYKDHNRLFFLTGFLSFSFFIVILAVIAWQVKLSLLNESFAMLQSEVISVSLDMSTPKSEPIEKQSEPTVEPAIPVESLPNPPKVSKEMTKTIEPEITDLFSTVKTPIASKSAENPKHLSQLNAIEEKVLNSKRDSKLLDKAKNLDMVKSGVKVMAASSGPKVNEYYAKVQGIIYANFHPGAGTEGFSARIRITLDANGNLQGYRVINYSGSGVFNAEVDLLKERLAQTKLPLHPQGEEATFDIILTAKD